MIFSFASDATFAHAIDCAANSPIKILSLTGVCNSQSIGKARFSEQIYRLSVKHVEKSWHLQSLHLAFCL
jgi:hypothetical protein